MRVGQKEKENEIKDKILELIKINNGASSTEIGKYINMSTVSAWKYINYLLKENLIFKEPESRGKNTRYFFNYAKDSVPFDKERIDDIISRASEIWNNCNILFDKKDDIYKILNEFYCYINKQNWQLLFWFQLFMLHKDLKNINEDEKISKILVNHLTNFSYHEPHWLEYTLQSKNNTISLPVRINIDEFYFCNLSKTHLIGRTKKYWELYYWKQNSDINLLKKVIEPSINLIKGYISEKLVDAIIFSPPTIARPIQFRDVFLKLYKPTQKEIFVSKKPPYGSILIPQSNINNVDEKIMNLNGSIHIDNIEELNLSNIKHILILDDIIETGSTANTIATKLRDLGWYDGRITSISILGKFWD